MIDRLFPAFNHPCPTSLEYMTLWVSLVHRPSVFFPHPFTQSCSINLLPENKIHCGELLLSKTAAWFPAVLQLLLPAASQEEVVRKESSPPHQLPRGPSELVCFASCRIGTGREGQRWETREREAEVLTRGMVCLESRCTKIWIPDSKDNSQWGAFHVLMIPCWVSDCLLLTWTSGWMTGFRSSFTLESIRSHGDHHIYYILFFLRPWSSILFFFCS